MQSLCGNPAALASAATGPPGTSSHLQSLSATLMHIWGCWVHAQQDALEEQLPGCSRDEHDQMRRLWSSRNQSIHFTD